MSKRDFFIEEARKVHGDKYDYSKVEYKRAHDKMCIICPIHGEFWQDKYIHLGGSGCPECGKIQAGSARRLTQDDFIAKCKKKWGDRYTYEHTVYSIMMKHIIVTCQIHGDFDVVANDFVNGHGCPKCGGTEKLTTETFIKKAREVHGDKYDYSKVNYVNNRTKVCIICHKKDAFGNEHGEFWQKPANHLSGDRCPSCYRSLKKTTEQFIEEAKQIHGNKYDYSQTVYNGNKKPITIICPKHGAWTTRPLEHLHGKGCKLCKQSHLEKKLEKLLNSIKLNFEPQKYFSWLNGKSLDFYLSEYNLAIECQGIQHFKSVTLFGGDTSFWETVSRDLKKKEECEEHCVKTIYVINDNLSIDFEDAKYQGIYTKENTVRICDFQNKILEICKH